MDRTVAIYGQVRAPGAYVGCSGLEAGRNLDEGTSRNAVGWARERMIGNRFAIGKTGSSRL